MNTRQIPSPRQRIWGRLFIACLVVGAFLAYSHTLFRIGFPLDDAWIHQTYARNIALKGEWSFTAGQPSAGSTAPLWTGLIAIGYVLKVEPRFWSYGLGIAMLMTTAWLAGVWLSRRISHRKELAWIAELSILLEWHLIWAGLSGMETLLVGLLAVAVMYWLDSGKEYDLALGAIVGLGIWIRPDVISLLLPVAIVILSKAHRELRRGFFRLAKVGIGMVGLVLPYLLFNWIMEGEWWPNTFYAKQAEYAILRQAPLFQRLVAEFRQPLVGIGAILIPGVVLGTANAFRKHQWHKIAPLIWVLAYLGIYAIRLPVTYQHGRYAMPTIPVILVIGLEGMLDWVKWNKVDFLHRIVSKAWAATLVLIALIFLMLGARAYATDVAIIETEMVAAAHWVAENTEPDALIAAHDIGALGYFGNHKILDLAGLVSPEVIPFIRDESALAKYLDESRADYLITFPDWYPELTKQALLIYQTNGPFSRAEGGENMAIYRLTPNEFAMRPMCMIYCPQSGRGRVTNGKN